MRVLVVNAGSSSLKLRLLAGDEVHGAEDLDAPAGRYDAGELAAALERLGEPEAVGHRVVHGGSRFRGPALIDEAVEAELRALVELAPLHQPVSLAALDAIADALPDVPAVACFDTAFHATLPQAAATYALPAAWRERWELRRYGFHGLSHAYASRRAAELLGREVSGLRTVTCHLGAGASAAAVAGGASVDTTMGFTPLEGLVMATRSGSVDPGLVLWLAERERIGIEEVSEGLERQAGVRGLWGSGDMRELLAAVGRGDRTARLALDVYAHRLRASIAAMAASMDGLDALVFTGGVGERAPAVRAAAAEGLGFLGIGLDGAANRDVTPDGEIGADDATVRALVVEAREDLEIARQVRHVLGDGNGSAAARRADDPPAS